MKVAIASLMLMVLSGCTITHPVVRAPQAPMMHVVVCWLKDPADPKAAQQLIDQSVQFRQVPGVVRVFAGKQHSVATTRPIDDTSFDVLVVMTFESAQALKDYQASSDHQNAVKKVLLPLTRKVVVYDAFNADTPIVEETHKAHKKKA